MQITLLKPIKTPETIFLTADVCSTFINCCRFKTTIFQSKFLAEDKF